LAGWAGGCAGVGEARVDGRRRKQIGFWAGGFVEDPNPPGGHTSAGIGAAPGSGRLERRQIRGREKVERR